MGCDIVALSSLGSREIGAWRELAASSVVPNPFAEPDVVMPAAARLNVPDVGMIVVRDAGAWIVALPVRSASGWRRVPGRCLTVWRHPYCYLGTPLMAPDRDHAAAVAQLLRRGTREPVTWAFALEWVDAAGPFGDALAEVLSGARREPVVVDRFERAFLERRPQQDYLQSAMSARHRKELRRTRRLLEAEVGALTVHDHSGDPGAPRRFLDLERSGWKGRAGTAMSCDPDHAALFEDLCGRWASAGRLQLLALQSEEAIVSMACNVRAGTGSFRFKIAFDEELARFSPGIHLEVATLSAFHDSDAGWMDSCAAYDNDMINRLWGPRRSLQTLIASSAGSLGTVGHSVWMAASAANDMRQRMTRRPHVAPHRR